MSLLAGTALTLCITMSIFVSPSSLQEIFHPLGCDIGVVPQHSMAPPSLKSCRFKRRTCGSKTLTQLDSVTAAARLPDEIFSQIARYALGDTLDELNEGSSQKPSFAQIDGLTRASRRLRAIALPEWFRLFIVRHVDDWMWAGRLRGMRSWVR